MTENTELNTIEQFILYLQNYITQGARFPELKINSWERMDVKLTIHVNLNNVAHQIYFDVREILENKNDFNHLLNSTFEQLTALQRQ